MTTKVPNLSNAYHRAFQSNKMEKALTFRSKLGQMFTSKKSQAKRREDYHAQIVKDLKKLAPKLVKTKCLLQFNLNNNENNNCCIVDLGGGRAFEFMIEHNSDPITLRVFLYSGIKKFENPLKGGKRVLLKSESLRTIKDDLNKSSVFKLLTVECENVIKADTFSSHGQSIMNSASKFNELNNTLKTPDAYICFHGSGYTTDGDTTSMLTTIPKKFKKNLTPVSINGPSAYTGKTFDNKVIEGTIAGIEQLVKARQNKTITNPRICLAGHSRGAIEAQFCAKFIAIIVSGKMHEIKPLEFRVMLIAELKKIENIDCLYLEESKGNIKFEQYCKDELSLGKPMKVDETSFKYELSLFLIDPVRGPGVINTGLLLNECPFCVIDAPENCTVYIQNICSSTESDTKRNLSTSLTVGTGKVYSQTTFVDEPHKYIQKTKREDQPNDKENPETIAQFKQFLGIKKFTSELPTIISKKASTYKRETMKFLTEKADAAIKYNPYISYAKIKENMESDFLRIEWDNVKSDDNEIKNMINKFRAQKFKDFIFDELPNTEKTFLLALSQSYRQKFVDSLIEEKLSKELMTNAVDQPKFNLKIIKNNSFQVEIEQKYQLKTNDRDMTVEGSIKTTDTVEVEIDYSNLDDIYTSVKLYSKEENIVDSTI